MTTRPRGIDDHAGAERALHLLGLLARHAEEAAEDRVVQERIAVLHHLGGVDIDHRRLHPLHDRRIGQLQFGRRGRHAAVLRGSGIKAAGKGNLHSAVTMAVSVDRSIRTSREDAGI